MTKNLINFALYQIGWFACVIGAARGYPWLGMGIALTLVAAHLVLARDRKGELRLMLCAAAFGLVADSIQGWLGLFRFTSGYAVEWLAPPWIVVMWAQFATTFRYALSWLMHRPWLAALLGLLAAPAAFWTGARLGAITFGTPLWLSLLSIALVWAVALPLLALVTRHASRSLIDGSIQSASFGRASDPTSRSVRGNRVMQPFGKRRHC